MRRTERTVITIETFQRTVIRTRQGAKMDRCERCAAESPSDGAAHRHRVHEIPQIEKADEEKGPESESVLVVRRDG